MGGGLAIRPTVRDETALVWVLFRARLAFTVASENSAVDDRSLRSTGTYSDV